MTLVSWCSFAAADCSARSLRAISPLKGVETLRVEILIGEGLAPEGEKGRTPYLFEGDFNRSTEFEVSLRAAIRDTLEACDIKVSAEAADVLHVAIYGRAVLPSDPRDYQVSLLEVRVLRDSLDDCDCETGEEPAIKTNLGFVADEDLEKSLISQVLAVLSETAGCGPPRSRQE